MIITALNSSKLYFEHLLVLLTSIKMNSPNDKISVFLVDFPKHVVTKLRSVFNNFEFIDRQLNINTNIGGFMTCYRTLIFKEYFENYRKPVAWLDVDIIVRKNLDPLWYGVETSQLKVLYRADQGAAVKFNTGILVIGYSEPTYKMIVDWNKAVQLEPYWYVNQFNLYKIYRKYKDKLKLIPMSRGIHDIGDSTRNDIFNGNSVIWHCKKNHFNDPRYQKEYQKYLKLGRDLFQGEFK